MDKDFDKWNEKKKAIDKNEESYLFKEGDIWWVSVGINVGSESCGKGETYRRPVMIYKKLSSHMCIVLPMTTKEKTGTWFVDVSFQSEKVWVLLYQIKTMDTKRFQRRIGVIDDNDFAKVKEKLALLLGFS